MSDVHGPSRPTLFLSRRALLPLFSAFCLLAGLSFAAPRPAAAAETVKIQPVSPEPGAADTAPGLMALYYFQKFNSIDEVDEWAKYKKGQKGGPIAQLNHISRGGNIFDSGVGVNVGMQIDGLIKFPAAGTWGLATLSNDGVRVRLDGKLAILDPYVHPDHMSLTTEVVVPKAGWYSLSVTYFQKGHSSALKLFWTKPGAAQAEIVPAGALAHLKK